MYRKKKDEEKYKMTKNLRFLILRDLIYYTNTLVLIFGYVVLNKIYLISKRLQIKNKISKKKIKISFYSLVDNPPPPFVDLSTKKKTFFRLP